MLSKEGKIIDRREMLRVKVKNLAQEAKLIRLEEKRARPGLIREELYLHRIGIVREAARSSHIAYGLIRGRTYEQIERTSRSVPDWKEVSRLAKKYGPAGFELVTPKKAA